MCRHVLIRKIELIKLSNQSIATEEEKVRIISTYSGWPFHKFAAVSWHWPNPSTFLQNLPHQIMFRLDIWYLLFRRTIFFMIRRRHLLFNSWIKMKPPLCDPDHWRGGVPAWSAWCRWRLNILEPLPPILFASQWRNIPSLNHSVNSYTLLD